MIPSHGKAIRMTRVAKSKGIRMTRVAKGKGNCGPNKEYIESKQGANESNCVYFNHFDVDVDGNYEWGIIMVNNKDNNIIMKLMQLKLKVKETMDPITNI